MTPEPLTGYLIGAGLVLVTATATAAALTREPVRQALVLGLLGLELAVLFTVLQAPDVALSQLAVGGALTPLLIVLTVRKVRRDAAGDPSGQGDDAGGSR